MRSVCSDLNRVLMPVMVILRDERRYFRLLNKTFRCPATKIDNSSHSSASGYIHHVEDVLDNVEHEIVLLFKARGSNSHSNSAVSHCRAENWNTGFVG